jgi:hypothetical protein
MEGRPEADNQVQQLVTQLTAAADRCLGHQTLAQSGYDATPCWSRWPVQRPVAV